jgi:hypothetical protein
VVNGGVDRTPHILPAMTDGWNGLRRGLPQSLIDGEVFRENFRTSLRSDGIAFRPRPGERIAHPGL